jgi:HK97 family phage prohead protease
MQVKNGGAMRRAEYGFCEIKFAADDGAEARTFTGYGAVFGNVDSYGDVIEKGAFKKTLAEANKTGSWPAMLMQHGGWGMSADDLTPVGIWTEFAEDDNGLLLTGKLAETPRGKRSLRPAQDDAAAGAQRPVDRLSRQEVHRRHKARRAATHLHEVELIEVSLVTFPANPKARIGSVKSATAFRYEMRRRPCVRRASPRTRPRRSSPKASRRSITGMVMLAATVVSMTPSPAP